MFYLDNAATTEVLYEARLAMQPYLDGKYGNAGSIHRAGRNAAAAVAKARRRVAHLINAEPEQIIFTSGGTEANNLAILGLGDHLYRSHKRHLIISAVEHDSVVKTVERLCDPLREIIEFPFTYDELGVNGECVVSVEQLKVMLDKNPDTGLVSVMFVNNETGAMQPVKEIAKLCCERGVLFHIDAVQAAGCIPIDIKDLGCNFLSLSAHKMGGCQGVGALYARDKSLLKPIIHGGDEQEFGLRGGTENVAGIVGFGEACRIAEWRLEQQKHEYCDRCGTFYHLLLKHARDLGVADAIAVNGKMSYVEQRILNLSFRGIDAETLVLLLDANGVCVSAGSACRSRRAEPSRVLLAMGLTPERAMSSVRFSFPDKCNYSDMCMAAKITADCAHSFLQKAK